MWLRPAAIALALLTAACGDDTTTTNEAVPVASPTPDAPPAPVDNTTANAADTAPAVALEGEGLRLIDPVTTHATPLPFGTAQATVIKALTAGMGGAPRPVETNSDCGPGPLDVATWSKGLAAYFQDGKFVGWGGAVDLKTMNGIGFGSTRKELVEAFHPTIEQTSLGTEFTAGGLSGVLESDKPDAAISDMWAGMTCVAR